MVVLGCRSEAANLPQPVPYYTTLRELGRGAMGVVYQARHNLTGQMVALKLIMPETATTRSAIDRFQREMSVISQLRHPNIVECYEQGMTRGQFWFAMEYVAGSNLETLAKGSPVDTRSNQGCRLVCQILKGLEQAHQLGFVHRDIKPENILIAQIARGADRQDLRLRPGQELPRRRPFGPDLLGRDARDGPVHAARADARLQDGHSAGRPLRHGGHALLPADLPVHLRRAAGGGDLIRMLLEEHPIPIRKRRRRRPDAAGRGHREVPGPGPQGTVPGCQLDATGPEALLLTHEGTD